MSSDGTKPIRFKCPKCGRQYRVAADNAGRKFRCRDCQTACRVPGEVPVPAAAAVEAAAPPGPAGTPEDPLIATEPAIEAEMPAAPPPRAGGNLIACPDCGRNVSPRAAACPDCGSPIAATPQPTAFGPTQVSVDIKGPKSANGFGIAALVLGIIACLTCWIPFIGLLSIPSSALGLLFGIIGLLTSILGRKSAIGMPIAGTVICFVAIVIAIAMTGSVAEAISSSGG